MVTMISILFLIIACLSRPASGAGIAEYIPITYKINQKQTECIYDNFEKSDFVTISVFVVEAMNNGMPKAGISFEGPLAGNEDVLQKIGVDDNDNAHNNNSNKKATLGRELRNGVQSHWPRVKDIDNKVRYDKRVGVINRSYKVDWTHAGDSEDAIMTRAAIEAEKKEAYRNYGKGAPIDDTAPDKANNDARTEKFRIITQASIEPYQETSAIKAMGWYRLCVSSDYHQLAVEMEMRSGKKLGGVDRQTGHVYTYEARELLDDENSIEEIPDSELEDYNTYATMQEEVDKVLESQVKEQDLHASKAQIKHLNTMVMEMKKTHHDYHHRIKSHKASAQRNYDGLIWSSKLETLLYVLITGVQVWTVRKWLLGNQLLGTHESFA